MIISIRNILSALLFIPYVYTRAIANDKSKEIDTKDDTKYGVPFHLYGLLLIIVSSGCGTLFPILLKKKSFFSVKSTLFNSLKMFGTGVIVTVAFVHMLSPADKMLSGDDAPDIFKENYDSFSGVFAVLGIILSHGIQVIVKDYFNNKNKETNYNEIEDHHSNSNLLNGSIHSSSTETDSLLSQGKNKDIEIKEEESNNYNNYNSTQNELYHENLDNKGCHSEALFLTTDKQIVSYLLEIGVSLHSILIGFAFGTNFDNDINFLLIALMIHQFFEGIALSTVVIEAKFKNFSSLIFMVIFYTLTMPLGGVGGLIIYNFNKSNLKIMTSVQGVLDSVAAGLLIYDSLVNILYNYTSSKQWNNMSRFSKFIQLCSFYMGCAAMAIVGIWA
ncbi:Zinc/iron permease [Piromyces finnis]|uniref:Zinc/iron permease n=1 Tax=Piromyces finnis TaxID=1754191 RepID=A0A1Y1VF72_9FUNG|nr:Zinc/iron permease [Piromyces finnis]|eukprot:ORX54744.1 Zinc/iron permease [Piromyces finnis]